MIPNGIISVLYYFISNFILFILDKPSVPLEFKVTSKDESSVTLDWEEPEDDGGCEITKYNIEKRNGKRSWQPADSTEDLEFKVTGLKEGQEFFFQVCAENEVGTGPFATLSQGVIPKSPHDPPGPPENVQITEVFHDSITMTWEPPESDGGSPVTGYYIERRMTSSSRWVKVTKEALTELTYTDKEVIEDTEYEYRIVAENKVGCGPPATTKPVVAKDPFSKFRKY